MMMFVVLLVSLFLMMFVILLISVLVIMLSIIIIAMLTIVFFFLQVANSPSTLRFKANLFNERGRVLRAFQSRLVNLLQSRQSM